MKPENVQVRITQHKWIDAAGKSHPFSQVLYTFIEDGAVRYACTRVRWALSDTPYGRMNEIESFLRRRRNSLTA
jgi:hypothetical protein